MLYHAHVDSGHLPDAPRPLLDVEGLFVIALPVRLAELFRHLPHAPGAQLVQRHLHLAAHRLQPVHPAPVRERVQLGLQPGLDLLVCLSVDPLHPLPQRGLPLSGLRPVQGFYGLGVGQPVLSGVAHIEIVDLPAQVPQGRLVGVVQLGGQLRPSGVCLRLPLEGPSRPVVLIRHHSPRPRRRGRGRRTAPRRSAPDPAAFRPPRPPAPRPRP